FNIGSPSVSINTESVRADEEPMVVSTTEPATEPMNERVGTTTDLGGVLKEIILLFTLGVLRPALGRRSAKQGEASAIKDNTLMLSISDDDKGLEDCLELKDATACHLKISAITPPAWKGFFDNHLDVDLLDLHNRCYTRQSVMDNAMNKWSRELLEAKENKGNLDRLMLEIQKWLGYQVSLLALQSKVSSLEAKKANHKATKASLRQEIEEVKHDRKEVVYKVVPYSCIELLYKALLLKNPPTLQKPIPSRTQIHVPSSQLAAPSSAPASNPMSPPTNIVKPSPSLNE
nr:hypothetical protein [Tanacetum cinerariifolium]